MKFSVVQLDRYEADYTGQAKVKKKKRECQVTLDCLLMAAINVPVDAKHNRKNSKLTVNNLSHHHPKKTRENFFLCCSVWIIEMYSH